MSDVLTQRPEVTDLRGAAGVPRGAAVLEDPTGRRRRRLRLVARALAALLTLWLVALLLGAVGISPVGLPLGRALRPTTAPPVQKAVPQPTAPSVADLKPAQPIQARVPKAAPSTTSVAPGKRALARRPAATKTPLRSSPRSAVPLLSPGANAPPAPPGRTRTKTTPTTTTNGHSETAPGRTKTAPSPRAGPRSTTTDTTTTP